MKREREADEVEATTTNAPVENLPDATPSKVSVSSRYPFPRRSLLTDPYVHTAEQYPTHVNAVQYSVLSNEEIHRLSVLQARRGVGEPTPLGINDARLGVVDPIGTCATCGRRAAECVGHCGHIDLEAPLFHLGFFPTVVRVCRTICKQCSRVLLTPIEIDFYTRRLQGTMEPLQRTALVNHIQTEAYKTRVCVSCRSVNGTVRRVRPMRLVHEKFDVPLRHNDGPYEAMDLATLTQQFSKAERTEPDIKDRMDYVQEFLDPVRVRVLFSAIPPDQFILLGIQPGSHPVDLLVDSLLLPPLAVRPRCKLGLTIRDDDLTTQYTDILTLSDSLKDGTNDIHKYIENWETLQSRYARLLDSSMPGFTQSWQANDLKSYAQRLKGKTGRFRGNLSGKRVDFSGRSVISPDPNLAVDELAVPLHVARILTYPQRVFQYNIEQLRTLVRNGPHVHPGAVKVYLAKEKSYKLLHSSRDRELLAAKLSIGDVVERHVINGDMILFNRQPSLHRISMMAHRARVLPYRTLRFNVCCCAPYNADFDGDEMNVHVVQTEEARAEAKELMLTAKNIINAKNGEPIIACIQDFLTAMYLVTSKEVFLDRSQFTAAVSYWLRGNTYVLPTPALLRPVELWTGKQLVELILRPTAESSALLNLEAKARSYSGSGKHLDPVEGFVAFLDSHLVSGRLDKKLLGGGAKDGLFARLHALVGGVRTAQCMSDVARFSSRYLQNYGFSLGLGDVAPTPSLDEKKMEVLRASFARCDALIQEASSGRLAPLPGLTIPQTLEAKLNAELSAVRDECGQAAVKTLDPLVNAPLIMVNSGSKGSALNTAQMMACVGQQTVNGKRIANAFDYRSLPHFVQYAESPDARGFVANSFYSGLTPTEFFFHTMAGREGLVDTAVKTAETGYIYRRLSKAMENLQVLYDGSVRHPDGSVVQLIYGEDGLDPLLMEGTDGAPLNLDQEWLSVRATLARRLQRRTTQREWLTTHGAGATGKQSRKKRTTERAAPVSDEVFFRRYNVSLSPEEVRQFIQGCLSGDKKVLEQIADYTLQEEVEEAAYYEQCGEEDTTGKGSDGSKLSVSDLVKLSKVSSHRFREEMMNFYEAKIREQERLRRQLGLGDTVELEKSEKGKKQAASDSTTAMDLLVREESQNKVLPLSFAVLSHFMLYCAKKYLKKKCDPGTPCGAIAAQSIGEPSTQMTLRTFHFAGVASMNITQGVPRLVEVINANRSIHTPVVTAPVTLAPSPGDSTGHLLLSDGVMPGFATMTEAQQLRHTARAVRGLLERVTLKEVLSEIVQVTEHGRHYLQLYLNLKIIRQLLLPIDATVVRRKLEEAASRPLSPLRPLLHPGALVVVSQDSLQIHPSKAATPQHVTFFAQSLLTLLPEVVVGGVAGVARVMMAKDGQELLAEGTALRTVMSLPHVDGRRVVCNHVMEVEKVLGIEAARATIVKEITDILKAYSLTIDVRHLYLLADVMTCRGTVLGITRYGIHKMNNNALTMASFERTTEHLYTAAVTQRRDVNLSVSESIIIGKPIPLGTSSFSLLLSPSSLDEGAVCGSIATGASRGRKTTPLEYDVHKNFSQRIAAKYGKGIFHPDVYYKLHQYRSKSTRNYNDIMPLSAENAFRLNLFV